jgi:hypothetical protein
MFHWMIKTPSKYQVYMLYAVPLMISSRFILHLLLFFDIQYRKAADGDVSEVIVQWLRDSSPSKNFFLNRVNQRCVVFSSSSPRYTFFGRSTCRSSSGSLCLTAEDKSFNAALLSPQDSLHIGVLSWVLSRIVRMLALDSSLSKVQGAHHQLRSWS